MYTVPDQSGRYVVVTGANSGTGAETAKRLAGAGAEVMLAVRTLSKGESAREEILRAVPGAKLEVRRLDLADLASVQEFAETMLRDGRPIDTLVNNAGVMAVPERMSTVDGFELQLGANFIGPFALTNLLLALILKGNAPRLVTMTSAVANFGRIRFGDINATRSYSPQRAYSQSKLANMLMAMHLAWVATTRGWGLLSTMAHPGFTRTNLQSAGPSLGRDKPKWSALTGLPIIPSQDVRQGAEPLLFAAADPAAAQGAYYGPSGRFNLVGPAERASIPRSARHASLPRSLWAVAEDLSGTRLPN